VLGFIGAALLIVSWVGTLSGLQGQVSLMSLIFVLPIAFWEFSLGIYLVVKGFRPSAITEGM